MNRRIRTGVQARPIRSTASGTRREPRARQARAWITRAVWSRRTRDGALGLLVLLGVAACTWQGIKPGDPAPKRVYISGRSAHVSDARIARIAAPYLKGDVDADTLHALQKRLSAQPWLTDVRVARHWPDGIVVHVADQKPVAYWGAKGVLAADGQVFVPKKRPAGLAHLSGPQASDAPKVYARYQRLSRMLAGHGVQLASLALDGDGNWRARLADGLVLRLGRHRLARRMHRFVRYALSAPRARKALTGAGYVDLRYSDGFAVGGKRQAATANAGHEESTG